MSKTFRSSLPIHFLITVNRQINNSLIGLTVQNDIESTFYLYLPIWLGKMRANSSRTNACIFFVGEIHTRSKGIKEKRLARPTKGPQACSSSLVLTAGSRRRRFLNVGFPFIVTVVFWGGFQRRNRLQRLKCRPERRSKLESNARFEVRRICTGIGFG